MAAVAAPAANAAVPAPAPATLASTLEAVQEYRDYKGKMNIFTSKLDEILYLCDMVDIDKIDQFLINFLETYDFYKKKAEEEGGYSDLTIRIDNIIKNAEYEKMTTYISKNYDNIKKILEKLNKEYNEHIQKYLVPTTEKTIETDLKTQKGNIIEKIETINRLLEIRNNINSIAPLPFEKLKFYNVAFINKNDIICAIDGYDVFKAIYKKLHVLNNEDKELNNKFEEVFKYEFYIIYTELHKHFKETLKEYNTNIPEVINNINEIKDAFDNYNLPQSVQHP
jgi:uncharacterized protein (UPF0248 family)/soluble cytochrome b562